MTELEQIALGPMDSAAIFHLVEPIVGLPLVDLWHPCSQVFEFGPIHYFENRKGEQVMRGKWSLDIECDWAVTQGSTVIIGSDDAVGKRKFYHRKSPPRDPNARRRWRAAHDFFKCVEDQALRVRSIEVEDSGFIRIRLDDRYGIHMFNTTSEDGPLWVLYENTKGVSHWVESESGVVIVTQFIGNPDKTVDSPPSADFGPEGTQDASPR